MRVIDKSALTNKPFPIMELPDELRLKIYSFLLPCDIRIILDPENIQPPSPHALEVVDNYGGTLSLILTCKKMHAEVTEFVYTHNIVTVIKPIDMFDFLDSLGDTACKYITKLEVDIESGLGDIGNVWSTMSMCPKLENLRLIFYHEKTNWSRTLAMLVNHVLKNDNNLKIEIELYTSVHFIRRPKVAYDYEDQMELHYVWANAHAEIFSFTPPSPLRKITLTASVNPEAALGLERWDSGTGWHFKGQDSADVGMKLLRWEKDGE